MYIIVEQLAVVDFITTGAEAKKVFDDAQVLLQRIIDEKLLEAHGIVTLLPAQSVGDDIIVYDEGGTDVIGVLHGLREQVGMIVLLYVPQVRF